MKNNKSNPIVEILSFTRGEKTKLIVAAILSIVSVMFGIIPYVTVGKLLITLFAGNVSMQQTIWFALFITGAMVSEKILSSVATWLSHKAAYGALYEIRCTLVEKIEHTSMGYIQGRQSGSFKQTIIDLVDRLEDVLAHIIPEIISNTILPICVVIYMFVLDWRIALSAFISIIIGAITWKLMMGESAMSIFQLTQEGNEQMNSTIVEYVNGMEVIKAFNQTATSMEKYENVVIQYRNVLVRWFRHVWPYLSVYSVVTPATIAFILPTGGILFYTGIITLKTFIMCLVLSMGIVTPIMKLVSFTDHINEIYAANTKIQEILYAPELKQATKNAVIRDSCIELKNVSFRYEEKEVLHNISFTANTGTTTAIVGPSGSGKSTIAKLIVHFWDTSNGSVLIGGVDVKEIPFDQLMNAVSFVSQDNFLPNISIKENIRMGKPNATDDEIRLVAKRACCDEFISKLPDGYETKAGDAGDRLSGGERQRIAIARAIIKDAPIIILDEATAAIDPENEYKVQMAIEELTKGKTLIIIAHRLSTIIGADQIIVLKHGTKVNAGTHEQLLESCPMYLSMWNNHIGASGWSIGKEDTVCGV
ncbi:ABC transporter ATP-binding protein [Enterocloster clostridioformis]|uniref:ABC transporter ATP-binding protein n=1 Tax=Bacteroides acidifaciens TaxID=85831 RepID=UPI00080C6C76|nr:MULTISPECIES: ABC transporter ATP-binding protein [Bacteria]ANU49729.1 ABC transporter related protein [Lachnoclostridium sp. YL32]NDO28819.1 ABC transporter ATP-binding protein [Enterocloster clostridioformis]OXE71219.1 ABC transporter ATP-binding protein [Enterocloster clostridioformis]QQR01362.1 ABC transporter ATP-binding protein [Enterocloster clostridioformis]